MDYSHISPYIHTHTHTPKTYNKPKPRDIQAYSLQSLPSVRDEVVDQQHSTIRHRTQLYILVKVHSCKNQMGKKKLESDLFGAHLSIS